MYILAFDREAEGQGSLYKILPTGEGATSTGVPSTTTPDTVTPPVTDEGEAEAEEGGVQKMRRMGTARIIMMERISMKIATKMNNYE